MSTKRANVVDRCKCRTGHHVHDGLAGCHSEGTVHACPTDQHTYTHETAGCDHTRDCPPRASLTTHDETTATCTCDKGYSAGPDQTGLQCVADAGSCGADQVGAPPDCTECGRHRVPNAAGTACEECPEGQEEGFSGQCMPVGQCTRLGSYWPSAENGCVRAGLVLANGSCRSTCRSNSADNGWGMCVCDPGYVYTVPTGALFGPTNCVERTTDLCGAAPDPGTCGSGGTWDSGKATCDCGDGTQPSGDGQSCEPCPEDAAGTGGVCETCGVGEVPNGDRTACVECPHGESSTVGTCNPDPCVGIECTGDHTHCSGGSCVCDTDHEDPDDDGHCSPVDPCAGVVCSGDDTRCSFGVCVCNAGYEDSDDDGDCAPVATPCDGICCAGANTECSGGVCVCVAGHHDPDGDGDCAPPAPDDTSCNGIVCGGAYTHCSGGVCVCNAGHENRGGVCRLTACTQRDVDVYAERILKSIPQEPWEEGHVYKCVDGVVTMSHSVSTKQAYDDDEDVCMLTLQVPADAIAMAHSHPYFTSRHRGVDCLDMELDSDFLLQRQNMSNQNFSNADRAQAEAAGLPFYLVVPSRRDVKVYSKTEVRNDSCTWETRTNL